jgi:hypothetical protein
MCEHYRQWEKEILKIALGVVVAPGLNHGLSPGNLSQPSLLVSKKGSIITGYSTKIANMPFEHCSSSTVPLILIYAKKE